MNGARMKKDRERERVSEKSATKFSRILSDKTAEYHTAAKTNKKGKTKQSSVWYIISFFFVFFLFFRLFEIRRWHVAGPADTLSATLLDSIDRKSKKRGKNPCIEKSHYILCRTLREPIGESVSAIEVNVTPFADSATIRISQISWAAVWCNIEQFGERNDRAKCVVCVSVRAIELSECAEFCDFRANWDKLYRTLVERKRCTDERLPTASTTEIWLIKEMQHNNRECNRNAARRFPTKSDWKRTTVDAFNFSFFWLWLLTPFDDSW